MTYCWPRRTVSETQIVKIRRTDMLRPLRYRKPITTWPLPYATMSLRRHARIVLHSSLRDIASSDRTPPPRPAPSSEAPNRPLHHGGRDRGTPLCRFAVTLISPVPSRLRLDSERKWLALRRRSLHPGTAQIPAGARSYFLRAVLSCCGFPGPVLSAILSPACRNQVDEKRVLTLAREAAGQILADGAPLTGESRDLGDDQRLVRASRQARVGSSSGSGVSCGGR